MLAVPGCGGGKDECSECSRGTPQLCMRGHHSGIGQDGFYAPYATIDVRGAVHVPKGLSLFRFNSDGATDGQRL